MFAWQICFLSSPPLSSSSPPLTSPSTIVMWVCSHANCVFNSPQSPKSHSYPLSHCRKPTLGDSDHHHHPLLSSSPTQGQHCCNHHQNKHHHLASPAKCKATIFVRTPNLFSIPPRCTALTGSCKTVQWLQWFETMLDHSALLRPLWPNERFCFAQSQVRPKAATYPPTTPHLNSWNNKV